MGNTVITAQRGHLNALANLQYFTRLAPLRRVLILSQYYAPESGAQSVRLRAMVRELTRLGFQVRVVTGMPNYPTGKIYPGYRRKLTCADRVDDVPLRRVWLYPASGCSTVKRILNYLSFTATSALALAFEPTADLIFVEAQPLTLALPALLNKWLRKTPYIYNTPDLQVEYADEGRWIGARWLIRAARALEALLMRQALSVTTVTHAFIDHFHRARHLPLHQFSFLPNGADTDWLRPLPPDRALADRLGIGDRKVFTFAGTHAPYQGIEVILQAARLLHNRTDLVFLLVGDGPEREQLMKRAAAQRLDNVLFRTSPFEEMPTLMSLTWASLVVLRAMKVATKMRLSKAIPPLACGVPLIYAGWGETAEIVEREGVGLRVEPEQPAALARAVETLADDVALRAQMGQRGRALAEREFAWSFLVPDWVRQIERIRLGQDPEVRLRESRSSLEPQNRDCSLIPAGMFSNSQVPKT